MISLYKHTAEVWIYEESTNEWGQVVKDWVLKFSDLKCTFGKKSLNNLTNTDFTTSLVKYTLHIDESIDIPIGAKIIFKETNQIFKAQFQMPYKFLKKKEVELETWT